MAGSLSLFPVIPLPLGWDRFAVGLNQESRAELEYLFQEWELEQDPAEFIGESMAPVRQAAIGPHAGGPGVGGTLLGAGSDGKSQIDCPP